MNIVRDNIVPLVIGSILSGVGYLLIGVYSDALPEILPALENIAAATYLKITTLLALLLLLTAFVAVTFYMKTRVYMPRVLSGKKFGYEWSAELDYQKQNEEVDIEIQWLCPKHSVFLHVKSAEIPETTYYKLFCPKCNHEYEMKSGGDEIYVQEAVNIVRREILAKLRFKG